jgi:NAD(P)-dependent dehydrogenase (short-subunit alcohol dehydrogenase family)
MWRRLQGLTCDFLGLRAINQGANSGLGLETARALAAAGATVVLACRSTAKCNEAMDMIRSEVPSARLSALSLDLSDDKSVRRFATGT